jgi:hypothetical protein
MILGKNMGEEDLHSDIVQFLIMILSLTGIEFVSLIKIFETEVQKSIYFCWKILYSLAFKKIKSYSAISMLIKLMILISFFHIFFTIVRIIFLL